MTLRRFRSDWNGRHSDKAYNPRPTIKQVKEALLTGKLRFGDCMIFAKGYVVEVRTSTGSSLTHNTYRDLYSTR